MAEDLQPTVDAIARPPRNDRILTIMATIGLAGSIFGTFFGSLRFGAGIFLGTGVAFANYFWLKHSLAAIFGTAASGERPRAHIGRYFLRYFALGGVVAVIYLTKLVPISSLILGMTAFAFATMVEGFIRIFSNIFSEKGS